MTFTHLIRKYIWLIALLAIASYLYFFRFCSASISPSNKEFAVTDTSSITNITIGNDSTLIKLNRTNKGWILNDNYKTRSEAIKALMNVIVRIDAKSPIPKTVNDSLTSALESNGIKVNIYNGESFLKGYSILATQTYKLGTIGKLNSSEIAFALQLVGFKGDVASLFVLDPDYWKSNRLFIADLSQIARIDVEIPNAPEKSFAVSLDNEGIHLKATYFDRSIEKFDTTGLARFIFSLTDLSFEKLLSKSSAEERAAIVMSQPEQIFTITLASGIKLVLKTYPIPVDEYRDEFGRTVKFDLNRLYISFNNDAIIAIANYTVFDPVLKDLSSFRLKN
ncbi:MAG: hypothetical protein EHM93_00425 [Bacteroidales bacterium]|nr:MAG: hypothetical protein EHM93_00425 [Bacteroidales bacterium]